LGHTLYKRGMDLTKYLECYDYFPDFTNFIFGNFAKEIRQRGFLVNRELLLIYVWKNFWRKNLSRAEVIDDEQKIKEVTEKIFRINHFDVHQVTSLLKELMTLFTCQNSLRLKVSSAVLTVIFPNLYGIFDTRVKRTLKIRSEDIASCAEAIFRMREIAKEQQEITGRVWTPRMIDMSLWTLNKHGRNI